MASKLVPTEVEELLPSVDDTKLGTGDLFNIESEVLDISPRWKKFGGALNIDVRVLGRIAAEKRDDPGECLRETLLEFLKMNYDTKAHGQPSWRLIVQAVAHRNGGNDKEVALDIARNHSTTKTTNGASGSGPTGGGAKAENSGKAENIGKAENKAILKERPVMQKLIMIPYRVDGQKKYFRPTQEIAPHWQNVVTSLGISQAVIVNAKRQLNDTDSVREALQEWITSDVDASWSKLTKAMRSVPGLVVSAKNFRTALLHIADDDSDDDDD
jgi:hypothetical protein